MKNKILSILLVFVLLVGIVPSSILAESRTSENNENKTEILASETKEINGKVYKIYEIKNLKLGDLLSSKSKQMKLRKYRNNYTIMKAGDDLEDWKLKIDWVGRGDKEFPFPEEGITIQLLQSGSLKPYGEVTYLGNNIDKSTGFGKPVSFKEIEGTNPNELGESVVLGIPDNINYDPQVFLEGAPRHGYTITAAFKQKVNPLFKSEWHIKSDEKPEIDAYVIDLDDTTKTMDFCVPLEDKIFSIYDTQATRYWDGTKLVDVTTGKEANYRDKNKRYNGKFPKESLLLGMYAEPRIEFGYGESEFKNETGYEKTGDKKYLLNVFGDHLTIKRFAVFEAVNVKFNTGKGSLTEGGDPMQDIGEPQEIGYSETIANNESGRTITVPDGSTLIPPAAEAGDPAKEFIGWAFTADATTSLFKTQEEANAYSTSFTKNETIFYAIYGEKPQGEVSLKYIDTAKPVDDNDIDAKYKLDDQKYPSAKKGNIGETVGTDVASTAKAPKFLGYKVTGVEVTPAEGQTEAKYTDPATATVTYKYEKLDPIIPEDEASDEVKKTYKKVTIKVDGEKGKFQKKNADVTGTEFVYYVNPVEGKSLEDVLNTSGLKAMSKDENANKIDTTKPWTFDPAKTAEKTPANVALTTEVNKTNFTGDVTMEVNFGQTIAEKFKNKLKDKDIKVWKGEEITWKDGVELKTADKELQGYLDSNDTQYADATTPARDSSKAQKDPFVGTIKITFSDNSTIEVPKQKLYVSEQKVEVKDPSDPEYIDPEHLPDDKVKIEIKLGEGVKEAKDGGKKGNAASPVLIKTFYVKPNTGLAEDDFPSTSGDDAAIVKQDNYKDPIKWNPSNLTQTWNKDGVYVASAESAQCKDPKVLQKEFEAAIDPMFENIKKKDGVYLGKYDKANKKVTVAIIDKTKPFSELKGTGLVAGLKTLLKEHNLIKYQVGNQEARDLKALEKASATDQDLVNKLAQWIGFDIGNEINGQGSNINTLADFIGKKITLKLTVQEPDCEANAVELTYTIEGKEAIASILKGKLSPQDIKVWKGDEIDWEKGVKKDETGLTTEQKEQIKDEFSTYEKGVKKVTGKAKFEDATTPARDSQEARVKPFEGNIKVTFSDGSELLVENQNLYVSDKITGGNNDKAPEDAITVQFLLGKGVKAMKGAAEIKGAEAPVLYETYKVKPDTNLDTYKLATGKNIFDNINAESMDKEKYSDVAWTPTNHVVTKTNNVFTANATETFIMKHTFKLIDKDDNNKEITELPETLKKLLPADKKVAKDQTYTPEKLKDILSVNEGGKYYDYKLQGWKTKDNKNSAKNEDATFIGTWTREQAASTPPTVVTPKEGDKTIGGDGKPGSKIIVKTPDGKEHEGEVNKDGKWTVDIPEAKDGDEYIVVQIEKGKKKSEEVKVKVRKKGNIEVEYPTSEIYVGDYKTVTPEIYGTSTTETDEAPYVVNRRKLEDMGVTVKAHSDGRLTIEIGENYRGPKRFTIDLDVYVDGQEIATYADVIVLEAKTRRPEAAVKTDDREILEHKAYIFGYPDGSVRPQGNITRAEAAAMIARLLNIEAFGSNTKPMFPDTPSAWYNRAINAVVQRGIMKGYPDGSFKPNDPITRAEFTTMIAAIDNKAYGVAPFADVKGHWAELAIGREYQAGRINGYPDGTFRPQRHITRAEAATILNKIFDRCYDAMSLIGTERKENVRIFTDLYQSFWGYNDMVEATNNHSFKRRVEGRVEEDWVEVK